MYINNQLLEMISIMFFLILRKSFKMFNYIILFAYFTPYNCIVDPISSIEIQKPAMAIFDASQ